MQPTRRSVNVAIGVQARTTSNRLPGKCNLLLGDKPTYLHVLDTCCEAVEKLKTQKFGVYCRVWLLIPDGDPLKTAKRPDGVTVMQGPEDDVLSRYMMMIKHDFPDYVVRITADCPLLPWNLIFQHIKSAVGNHADYCSNTIDETRTSLDGHDVEVMSLKLMQWLNMAAKDPKDREHVTSYFRNVRPSWARVVNVIHRIDQSKIKLSLDTQEDYERIKEAYDGLRGKIATAEKAGHIVVLY